MKNGWAIGVLVMGLAIVLGPPLASAQGPSVQQALQLKPLQKDAVEYDTPSGDALEACTISSKRFGKNVVGWVIEDGNGLTLRRFLDTDGDNKVDTWCYYSGGIEVYRDIDSNGNGKADQYRWLNTAGTRWGIDRNEDGRIDAWKTISPEEVAHEVVQALATGDAARFQRVLLTSEELEQLPLRDEHREAVAEHLAAAKTEFSSAASAINLGKQVDWVQFSASRPGVVPGEAADGSQDVYVYESALAFAESEAGSVQLMLGTLIEVGSAWRLVDAPTPVSADSAAASRSIFFASPAVAGTTPSSPGPMGGAPSEEVQELISQMEQIEQAIASAGSLSERAKLHAQWTDVIEEVIAKSSRSQDRAMWIRQMADMVSAAVQAGSFPEGAERLKALYEQIADDEQQKDLAAYVRFRQLVAEYGLATQAADPDYVKLQEEWIKNLEGFIDTYPNSTVTAEALLQLAVAQEYAGQEEEAEKWYQRIVSDFPNQPEAVKARGAVRRLNLEGQRLQLSGHDPQGGTVDLSAYRGKAVLIQFWATWCEPCKDDMPVIKDLLSRYGSDLAVIGINLDSNPQNMQSYIQEHRLSWPQIYEDGGLDSGPANDLGVVTLPTMILVDQEGRVVRCGVQTAELDDELERIVR